MTTLPPEIMANIAGRRLNINQAHDTGLQQLGNQYNTGLQQLDQYSTDSTRRVNDQYAAQGLFNSGIRVDEQGRLQRNVGEKRTNLGQDFATKKTGIESQYQNALQGLTEYQNEQMLGQARSDLQTQLQQQQFAASQKQASDIAAWNAALAGNAGATAAPAAPAGPDPAALKAWYDQAAINQWYAVAKWNEAIASQNRQQFAGAGNPLGYAGATFQ